jgi:hypothetical protein
LHDDDDGSAVMREDNGIKELTIARMSDNSDSESLVLGRRRGRPHRSGVHEANEAEEVLEWSDQPIESMPELRAIVYAELSDF